MIANVFDNTTAPEDYAIGAALSSAEAANALKELEPSDMITPYGSEILSAMKRLDHVDLVTLNEALNNKYFQYLTDVCINMPLHFQVTRYIDIIKDRSRRRQIQRNAQELIHKLSDVTEDPDEAAAAFEAALTKHVGASSGVISAQEATFDFIDTVDAKPPQTRVTFGIPKLDEALGGVFGGKLIIVGARPGTGKTAIAISAAMSTQASGDVLFCSYEMSPTEIMGRVMANLSGVNAQRIAYRDLDTPLKLQMGRHYSTAAQLRINFTANAYTPAKIRREAMRLTKTGKLALIVVDYIQLMSSGIRAENRRVEVGQISRQLKQLAMELDVPIMALSQLNRQSEATASKAPTTAELRESGDLEQDADVIVLMYAPPHNDRDYIAAIMAQGYRCIRILLEKNRQGMVGVSIDTAFDGAHMRFLRVTEATGYGT